MKSTAIVSALVAASMGLSSVSFAQGFDRRGPGAEHQRHEQRAERHEARRDVREARRDVREDRRDLREARRDLRQDRRDHRFDNRDQRFHAQAPRHYYRGGYLPPQYRGQQYVVNDWQYRHLNAPPRGYHWVRGDNGDVLLVAIATGLIANLLLNQF